MDFSLSSEQASFQELARNFAKDHLAPHAGEWDRDEIFPIPTLREAAKLGFGGIMVKEAYEGSGLKRLDSVLIFEELAKGCPSIAGYLSVHNMVSTLIDRYGTSGQHQKWCAQVDYYGMAFELLLNRAQCGQ